MWSSVTGPVSALLASLHRLGWCMPNVYEVIDDQGCCWNFTADPPAALMEAGRRAVRRWRFNKVGESIPGLIPTRCDLPQYASLPIEQTMVISFDHIIGGIMRLKACTKDLPFWSRKFRGDLASAISGGQWAQTSKAGVPQWNIQDTQCQLCKQAAGTLPHRFECAATRPTEGWPRPPASAHKAYDVMDDARRRILQTRGLLALRVPRPVVLRTETFQWFIPPPEDLPDDVTWYMDGSMGGRDYFELRAVGFALVIISRSLGLLAMGGGTTPWWCNTAAAAEAWALYITLSLNMFPPQMRTDCYALLTTAEGGIASATMASRPLARVWSLIGKAADNRIEALVQERLLVWIPAHTTAAAIVRAKLSNNKLMTVVDWRANRLVDALAKACANDVLPMAMITDLVNSGGEATKHAAALLGAVTHTANNFKVKEFGPDNEIITKTLRDSQKVEYAVKVKRKREPTIVKEKSPATAIAQPVLPPAADEVASDTDADDHATSRRKSTKKTEYAAARKRSLATLEAERLCRRVTEIVAACTSSPSALSGAERLEALKRRVRARLSE